MGTLRMNLKTVFAILLTIAGLCAAPAAARSEGQAQQRLLFLGISKDGRAHQAAESAVQLRLAGLEVLVVRPEESPAPPCDRADCMSKAVTLEHADLALAGRILRSDRACLATLWLANGKEPTQPMVEQDIVCRPDGKDIEVVASLADGAAAMVDNFLHRRESEFTQNTQEQTPHTSPFSQESNIGLKVIAKTQLKWSKGRKFLVTGLSLVFLGGIASTIAFATAKPPGMLNTEPREFIAGSFGPEIAVSGILSGSAAGALLLLVIK